MLHTTGYGGIGLRPGGGPWGVVTGGFGVGLGASGIGTGLPGQGRETGRETPCLKVKKSFMVMFLTTENSIIFFSGVGTGVGGFGPGGAGPVGAGRG